MRVGLIADIHGNLAALETVLAELESIDVDRIVCLGDLAVLGPRPDETISRIREEGISTVCGNTDVWLAPGHAILAQPPDSRPSIDLTEWAANRISNASRAFLAALPLTISIPLESGRTLVCCHGSPNAVDDIMPRAWADGGGEVATSFLAGGHTHIQEMRRFGDVIYINPGSAGLPGVGPGGPDLPVNRDVAWAEFAVLDDRDGSTEVSLQRVALDVERMWVDARQSGMPHADWWRSRWAPK